MSQHHLITGGSGFLGNLIAKRLIADGEQVTVLDLWENPLRPAQVRFVQGDILDRTTLSAVLKDVDVVHHNAALVPLAKAARNTFRNVNVKGSRVVAEEALKAGVRRLVHMSSSAIFGHPRSPILETTEPAPIEVYGQSKAESEVAVREVTTGRDMQVLMVRPRTILAPSRLGIFQILFEWIQQGKNVYVIGPGDHLFQFIHADDLLQAYMLALREGKNGVLNVGTDRFSTLRSALQNLITHAGTRSKVKSLPTNLSIVTLRTLDRLGLSPLAPWHYLSYHREFHFDIQPLKTLGWTPKYSNDAMLSQCYDWYCANQKMAPGESVHTRAIHQKWLKLLKLFS